MHVVSCCTCMHGNIDEPWLHACSPPMVMALLLAYHLGVRLLFCFLRPGLRTFSSQYGRGSESLAAACCQNTWSFKLPFMSCVVTVSCLADLTTNTNVKLRNASLLLPQLCSFGASSAEYHRSSVISRHHHVASRVVRVAAAC